MPPATHLTLFGGTGFLGRELLRHLSRLPIAPILHIHITTRKPSPTKTALLRSLAPTAASVTTHALDAASPTPDALHDALQHSTHVANLIGILYETPRHSATFSAIHANFPAALSEALAPRRGMTLAHVSALGAHERSESAYARSKAAGEDAALRLSETTDVTILRPSLIYGPEDAFFNRFNALAALTPFLPLVGGGHTRFQPVHVADVAAGLAAALRLSDPPPPPRRAATYELVGPDVLSFRELMQLMLAASGRRRALLPLPFALAELQAVMFEGVHAAFPAVPPMLTRDQLRLLRRDNVGTPGALTLADLGVVARACNRESVDYLRAGARSRKSSA